MASLPRDKVKQGFWIDWSRGQILGSTITTTTTTANVVVAILAVVVSLASLHLWHLFLFSFYQIRAKNDLGDGLYRQQQALFRSVTSPEQTLWDFARLGWTWRGKARNSVLRSSGPILVALAFTVLAFAASLSSSFIVDTSAITVLADSNNCGLLTHFTNTVYGSYLDKTTSSAQDYARNCYLKDITSGFCTKFVKSKLNFTVEPASCPFSPSMCVGSEENAGITLDTGYLDSNDDFGLNARPSDRVQARKRTTCAPIKVPGYYNTVNATAADRFAGTTTLPGEQAFRLEYGVQAGYQGTPASHFTYDTYLSNLSTTYQVSTQFSGPSYGNTGNYIPIKPLKRSDADTALVWIFPNSVQYTYQVDDPVFLAHQKSFILQGFEGGKLNYTVYGPDNPFGAVACAEQYQFCVTTGAGLDCTDLGGLPMPSSRAALTSNGNQLATFHLIYNIMLGLDMSFLGVPQTPVLTSNILQSSGIQAGYIPNDQWKREVILWESFILSCVQTFMAGRAIGPGVTNSNGSEVQFTPPSTPGGKRLCKAQKMMVEGGFGNISVFGLAFTIAISGLLVIVDLLFLRILVFLSKFTNFWGFNVDSWVQDGVLQLQRKAYEGAGQGNWSRRDKEIPTVERDDQLYKFGSETKSEEGKFESWRTDSTADKTVDLDPESPKPPSTLEKDPVSGGQDAEIVRQSADSANATFPVGGGTANENPATSLV